MSIRLRPIQPIFNPKKLRGAINIGNTPPGVDYEFLGSYTDSTLLNEPYGLTLVGTHVLVACDTGDRLTSIDISDPTNPVYSDSLTGLNGVGDADLADDNTTVYTIGSDGSTFWTIDATDPTALVLLDSVGVGSFPYHTANAGSGYAVYTADVSDEFGIINATDPSNINVAADINSNLYFDYAYGVIVKGDYAFVVGRADRFNVVDISNKVSPSVVASLYDVTNYNYHRAVCYEENTAFSCSSRLTSTNITDPTNPSMLQSIALPYSTGSGHSTGIAVKNGLLYVPQDDAGCAIYNVKDPNDMTLVLYVDSGSIMDGCGWARRFGNYLITTHPSTDTMCINRILGG